MFINLVITLVSVILLIVLASASRLRSDYFSNRNVSVDVVRGLNILFIVVFIFSNLYFLGNTTQLILCYSVIVTILIRGVLKLRFNYLQDSLYLLIPSVLITLFVTLIVFKGELATFRFHTNPDTYGYAAGTGYFLQNFSLHDLNQQFQSVTGWTNWNSPGPQPLLSSPWLIPDQQMRYASDTVLHAGRAGIPLLFSIILRFTSDNTIFYTLWILLGLIVLILIGAMTFQVIQNAKAVRDLNSVNPNNNGFNKSLFIWIVLVAAQPWLILMVLEGQLPQLWTLVNTLYFLDRLILISKEKTKMSKIIKKKKLTRKNGEKIALTNQTKMLFYDLILVLVSLYIVYPQAILTLAVIFFPVIGVLAFGKQNHFYHGAKAQFYWMVTLWILLLFLSSKAGTLEIVSQIVHSGVGGGIHIGILGVNDLLGMGFNLSRMRILDPSYLAIIESPYFAASTVVLLEILILKYLVKKFRKTQPREFIIELTAFIVGLIALGYLALPIVGLSPITIDYVWFRYVTLFILLAIPALSLMSEEKFRNLHFPRRIGNKSLLFMISLTSLGYLGYSSNLVGGAYLSHTAISKPLQCPDPESLANSYVYSEGYFYSSASYVICGPFNFLTDASGPFFKGANRERDFVYLNPRDLSLTKGQKKVSTLDIQAPCDVACVKKLGIQ